MNVEELSIEELVTDLIQQGIKFEINEDKLQIRSPQAVITDDLRAKLGEHKPEIMTFLRQVDSQIGKDCPNSVAEKNSGLDTIGRIISGYGTLEQSREYRSPVIDAAAMAKSLVITFRDRSQTARTESIQKFSDELKEELQRLGVNVISWQDASKEYRYDLTLPFLGFKKTLKKKIIQSRVNAVIDIEKPLSVLTRIKIALAEGLYSIYKQFGSKGNNLSVPRIALLTGWAEDHAALQLEDPMNTQVIMLTPFNPEFANPQLSYSRKIKIGLNTLVRTFSEIVIGVSETQLSILNMNLSDSVFPRSHIREFILNSLIPKVFVPILPLSLSRFTCSQYSPSTSPYARNLMSLSHALATTNLFPSGSKLSQVIKRPSHRDLVDVIVNGRTGVSYGFVAYAEPPQYVGSPEITETEWGRLRPVPGFGPNELRQNEAERWYLKINRESDQQKQHRFQQIPDIWIISSRSGSSKTDLNLDRDVIRMGLKQGLFLQTPQGSDPARMDIKPSYDIYVMLAIALSAALYTPNLIANGAPMIHFHGYPSAQWFQPNEYCVGVKNPSVPCGTYESGILNYLGLQRLTQKGTESIDLVSLIEPDHGTNIIAHSWEYLVERLQAGCTSGEIQLGGVHFTSLQHISIESA